MEIAGLADDLEGATAPSTAAALAAAVK